MYIILMINNYRSPKKTNTPIHFIKSVIKVRDPFLLYVSETLHQRKIGKSYFSFESSMSKAGRWLALVPQVKKVKPTVILGLWLFP